MICFSANNTVRVRDVGDVPMDNLKIGDMVQVADGSFEPVYSFCKRSTAIIGDFLQLHTNISTSSPLELSSNHLVFALRRGQTVAIPAAEIVEGDLLVPSSTSTNLAPPVAVTRIGSVQRQGIYAPYTSSGTIVVNGLVASTYATVGSSPWLWDSEQQQHIALHIAQSHHRLICSWWLGLWCRYETYDATSGLSSVAQVSFWVHEWWENQSNKVVQWTAASLLGAGLVLLHGILHVAGSIKSLLLTFAGESWRIYWVGFIPLAVLVVGFWKFITKQTK